MAKHSALNRANGVRLPADPRDPGSANGRPLRSERSCRGSNPRPGTPQLGDRLRAGRQVLTLFVEVRILVPERIRCATNALSDNRIVDDARGRAPPRPRQCPRSRSGDGACLKRRRCWFNSRRGHYRGTCPVFASLSDVDRLETVTSLSRCVPRLRGEARADERRFREPEAAGPDPAILTSTIMRV